MVVLKGLLNRIVNSLRPNMQVKFVRGRWCAIKKVRPTVYQVSVIDRVGNYVGARFITPLFGFDNEVDNAVRTLLLNKATY